MLNIMKMLAKTLTALAGLTYTNFESVYQDYCKVERKGNVVNVYGISSGGWNITAGTYVSLTTLPTWARPSRVVVDTVEAYGSATADISIQINPSGIVQLYCPQGSSWWRYNVTYLVGG